MEQWEGRRRGVERLLGQMQHHRGILADRIQHHRIVGLRHDFTQDVDALGFKPLKMGQIGHRSDIVRPDISATKISLPGGKGISA